MPCYSGQRIPAGAFDSFTKGVVSFDLEWNVTASAGRPRPNGGGNGKVAALVLAKTDSSALVEACVVQLACYDDNFPDELRAVFASKEVHAVL